MTHQAAKRPGPVGGTRALQGGAGIDNVSVLPTGDGFEWRVVWRRVAWRPTTANKERRFRSERAALTFAGRLVTGWPGTSAPIVRVETRPATPWSYVAGEDV